MTREMVLKQITERAKAFSSLKDRKLLDYIRETAYVPIVVAYGAGVDSTAMLVELHNRDITPDMIIFSDTGSERPETYAYLDVIQGWLKSVHFPPVIVIRRDRGRTTYDTLHGECLTNKTLPAISVGLKSCSIKWKIEPFNKYLGRWGPAVRSWDQGGKVVKAIGFDAGVNDGRRILDQNGEPRLEDDRYIFWYPLIEWGLDREACKEAIRKAGLPVPVKSACFMCGCTKEHEIDHLEEQHPDLLEIALEIERRARPRLKRRPRFGLNRGFSWGQYLLLKKRQSSFLGLLDSTVGRASLPLVAEGVGCPGGWE